MTANFYEEMSVQGPQQEQNEEVSCVQFNAMSLSFEASRQYGSQQSNTSESTASTLSSTRTNLSGWGSAISRKPYACLKTLGENESRKMNLPRQSRAAVPRSKPMGMNVQGDSWGYFVDTPEY